MLTQPTSLDMLQNYNSKQFMCVPTNNTSKQVFHPPFTVLKTETQRSDSAEVTQPENGNAGIPSQSSSKAYALSRFHTKEGRVALLEEHVIKPRCTSYLPSYLTSGSLSFLTCKTGTTKDPITWATAKTKWVNTYIVLRKVPGIM